MDGFVHPTNPIRAPDIAPGANLRQSGNVTIVAYRRTATGERLGPAWPAFLHRYFDRFLVGSDTGIPSRWGQVSLVWTDDQVRLDQLPADLADRLAFRNAEALAKPAG